MIVPVSSLCTDRTESVQKVLFQYEKLWGSSFDLFPARLFEGAAQRLAIIIGHRKKKNISFNVSSYLRWLATERLALFQKLSLQDVSSHAVPTWIPRLGNEVELRILKKLHGDTIASHADNLNGKIIYIHRIVNNYVKAVSFPPYFKREGEPVGVSPDFKKIKVTTKSFLIIQAMLNSSLFYWYWRAHGDGFHCGLKDIRQFPLNLGSINDSVAKDLSALAKKLNDDLNKNSEIRIRNQVATGRVELQTFFVGISTPILNEIDTVLARHYGLTSDELDFILNYDIKYRMGASDEE